LHKYLYAQSNPVNRVDPSGKDDFGEEDFLTVNAREFVLNQKRGNQTAYLACLAAGFENLGLLIDQGQFDGDLGGLLLEEAIRPLEAKPGKIIVAVHAAIPSSWKTPPMLARMVW
jgi:hypothetical protein